MIKLKKDEYIVAIKPETCGGSGWTNQLIWIIIGESGTKKLRQDAIQSEDFTEDMWLLFNVCEVANKQLLKVIGRELKRK